ncbi:PP2C family protein-serine/threonine phosphatase [Saccharothrix sp. BKS2]|uniref:PP2C family protein-serine/threonine phosphatase n=1 Tax=Saccharothrix sp. BKS2 TaxID=3064400 RepID=UPI0039E93DF3
MTDHRADRQQRSTAAALRHAGLTVDELWLRYFALGGDLGLIEVDAYVHGLGGLPPLQRDVLAHAVNERLDELAPPDRADYSWPIGPNEPRERSLDALVKLLEGAELAPPDRLPLLIDAAGRSLGVRITPYLADHQQRLLHPWPAVQDGREPLGLDTTPAGLAFRQVRVVPVPEHPRLWVPLLDGVERLGVLDVEVDDPLTLRDPGLRTQCRWLSMLLGHLVTLLTRYGDAADLIRLPAPRTVPGELTWSLLPPLTAGVDGFVLTGAVEPGERVSGDTFDYALSETTATLVVLDADGHDLRAGLITATAVAAHRSARHAGLDLIGQARAIDEAIRGQFGPGASATATLVEVDLATGRLCYLNAGHPRPVIVRSSGGVEPLTAGQAPPLGSGLGEPTPAREALAPDDWLVLHTDGITDVLGDPSAHARLAEFLRREAAEGHPPPETARQLLRALRPRRDGGPREAAAVLLARWTDPRALLP